MTANEYLSQVYNLKRKIKYNLARLEELRELSCSISAPALDKVPSGNRCTEAPFVKALERIWEKEEEINREMDELERKQKEIQAVIEKLTDVDERYVLLYRYMQGMKWEDISLELRKRRLAGRTVTLKIRYFDFRTVTRSRTGTEYLDDAEQIADNLRVLLLASEAGKIPVRLIGASVSRFPEQDRKKAEYFGSWIQPDLFSDPEGEKQF